MIKELLYNQFKIAQSSLGRAKTYLKQTSKSPLQVILEHEQWLITEQELNSMYFAWGLNELGAKSTNYISRNNFLRIKNSAEQILKNTHGSDHLNYDVLTKDKFITGSFLRANNVPCIPDLGLVISGKLIPFDNQSQNIADLIYEYKVLYFKNITLESSEGVVKIVFDKDKIYQNNKLSNMETVMKQIQRGVWLIQPHIVSHAQIRKVNDSALNTTRIVTILGKGLSEYLAGFQAFATGDAVTDAWSKGSIYVGIDVERGSLKKYGFHNLSEPYNSVAVKHPDSGVEFENYPIPFLKESVELCIKGHQLLYNNFIIGWDVAITDSGPLIVEANEKPGMNVIQCVDGGLRKVIEYHYNTLILSNRD